MVPAFPQKQVICNETQVQLVYTSAVPAQVKERGKNLQGIPVGLDLYFGGEELSVLILRGSVVYT